MSALESVFTGAGRGWRQGEKVSNGGSRDLWAAGMTDSELLVLGSCSMYANWPLVVS